MTVYVDNMRAGFRRMVMCHMIASCEDELHSMADKIGVARRWYRGDHYDICLSKRAKAVAFGAVEITVQQAAGMRRRLEVTGFMGEPCDAKGWLLQWLKSRRSVSVGLAGDDLDAAVPRAALCTSQVPVHCRDEFVAPVLFDQRTDVEIFRPVTIVAECTDTLRCGAAVLEIADSGDNDWRVGLDHDAECSEARLAVNQPAAVLT